MEIPNINWMDDVRVPAKPRKTARPKTSRKDLQAQLDVIRVLHHFDLIVGFAPQSNEQEFTVDYLLEWRGRYGWNASVLIYHNDVPQSQMSIKRAYDYIRVGSSIREVRGLMKYLPWD